MRLVRWLWRAVRALALLGAVLCGATLVAVQVASDRVLEAHRDGVGMAPVDAIIVLGSGVDGDGVLGYSSRRRIAAAVAAWRAGKARAIITTGGTGAWHPGVSSAALMADHAIALGLPPGAVLLEERSTTTLENLRFAFDIADAAGMARVALASDAFHLVRARALAGWLGRPDLPLVAADGLAREPLPMRAVNLLREAAAWWFNLGKVIGWEAMALAGMGEAEIGERIR